MVALTELLTTELYSRWKVREGGEGRGGEGGEGREGGEGKRRGGRGEGGGREEEEKGRGGRGRDRGSSSGCRRPGNEACVQTNMLGILG